MAALRCIGIGLITTGIGTISAAVNLLVTILTLRAPGMTLRRLPLFVWMVMLNSVLLLAIPALNASIAMLLFDRLLSAHFFDVPAGRGFSRPSGAKPGAERLVSRAGAGRPGMRSRRSAP